VLVHVVGAGYVSVLVRHVGSGYRMR